MRQLKNIMLAVLVIFSSCKEHEISEPEFSVSTDKSTYKLTDYVTFNFTGNPDFITFFSGERGADYMNVSRTSAAGTPVLKFTSARANGTQANSLQLMVSADFKGMGVDEAATAANIATATWTDITDRAVLSTGPSKSSGDIDLSDIAINEKPVYIAFKYTAASGTTQNKWTISGLTVTNTLADDAVYTIANLNTTLIANYGVSTILSPGWVGAKVSNNYDWVIKAGSSLTITGAANAAAATAEAESWVFSGPIDLNKVSADIGVPIKEASARLNSYTYTFKSAGNYTVSFVAANSNHTGAKEIVKTIQLSITE